MVVPEPRHTYLRKLIMPAFTNEAIERLVPRMEAVLTKYIDAWAGARLLGFRVWGARLVEGCGCRRSPGTRVVSHPTGCALSPPPLPCSAPGAGSPVKAHDQLRKMTFEFIIAVRPQRRLPPPEPPRA